MDTLQTAALSLGLVVSAINGLSLSFTVYDMWVAQSPLQYTSQRFVVFAMDTLIGGIFAYSAGSWELGFNRTLNAVLAILYLWVFGLVLPGKGAGAELWTQVALLSATALALWQTTLAQVGWIQTANVFGSISTASGVTQAILPMVQVVRNILRPTAPDQTVNSLQPKIIKSKDARSIPLPWTIMAFCSGYVSLTSASPLGLTLPWLAG